MCKYIITKMLPMEAIKVAERIRKDNGNLRQLADDIQKRGLINPITVMEQDEGYLLIAGYRRMEATRLLGETAVLASVVSAVDADEQLMLEIAENEQRKEFTLTEKLTYADRLKAIEKEKGRQRMSAYARAGRETEAEDEGVHHGAHPEEKGRTRDIISKKAGFTSHRQMERAAVVAEKRPDLLAKVETGEMSLRAAYLQARGENTEKSERPVEKKSVREIQNSIVTAAPVERETVVMFNPMTVPVSGSKTSLKGADHEHLLDNPVYAALYDEYAKAVQTANSALGRVFSNSEGYEKRIRGYEENIQAMQRTIEGLRSENERLRVQLEGIANA